MKKEAKILVCLLVATLFLLPPTSILGDRAAAIEKTNGDGTQAQFVLASDEDYTTQTNIFDEIEWIHFDNGENVNALGLTAGGTWEFGIRCTPDELEEYDSWWLSTVRFCHGMIGGSPQPPHDFTIEIFEEGTPTEPGDLITSENFTAPETGWFNVTLLDPVLIDGSKDKWVILKVTQGTAPPEYPAGMGPGPAVAGKGDWLRLGGGAWQELKDIGFQYNFNVWAGLQEEITPPANVSITDVKFGGRTISVELENTGGKDSGNVTVSVNTTRVLLGTTEILGPINVTVPANETKKVDFKWLGFGHYHVTATAEGENVYEGLSEMSKDVWWFIFLGIAR
jgi:hypothetical protein